MNEQWTDILMEMTLLIAKLEAKGDADYASALRRRLHSNQSAHGAPIAEVHRLVRDWLARQPDLPSGVVLDCCEMLWATGWREERIAAIDLHRGSLAAIAAADWSRLERWSGDIDNWELADHLARLTSRLLLSAPRRYSGAVRLLATSESPWQRRLGLVTLILASRDRAWLSDLAAMTDRLQQDASPPVRSAVRRARRRLAR